MAEHGDFEPEKHAQTRVDSDRSNCDWDIIRAVLYHTHFDQTSSGMLGCLNQLSFDGHSAILHSYCMQIACVCSYTKMAATGIM